MGQYLAAAPDKVAGRLTIPNTLADSPAHSCLSVKTAMAIAWAAGGRCRDTCTFVKTPQGPEEALSPPYDTYTLAAVVLGALSGVMVLGDRSCSFEPQSSSHCFLNFSSSSTILK